MKNNLNKRQRQFSKEYLIDLNASAAAVRSGYTAEDPSNTAQKLLDNPKIREHIAELTEAACIAAEVNITKVLRETATIAFSDVRKLFDEDGRLIPVHMIGGDIAPAVSSVDVVTRKVGQSPEDVEYVSKIKFWDKLKAIELLGKYLRLFVDRVEHSGVNGEAIEVSDTQAIARLASIIQSAKARNGLE